MCRPWVYDNPVEAEAILAKWAEEHPEKTIADDFYEKFPKAPRNGEGVPHVCAVDIGYSMPPFCDRNTNCCAECWRRPLEEVEG
jgi:ABC-type nitrate/sulfonate/bicarbonate transport system substrate-binding protein